MYSCENNSIFQDQKHIEEWHCFALLPASLIPALMEDRWILIAILHLTCLSHIM